MNSTTMTAFADELVKIADPSVADKASSKRRMVGVAGGILGGAAVIPAAISGLAGGATGVAAHGLKGLLPGMWRGAKKPIALPIQSARAMKSLSRFNKDPKAVLSAAEHANFGRLLKNALPESLVSEAGEGVKKMTAADSSAVLRSMPLGLRKFLHGHLKEQLTTNMSGLGIGGLVGGGSAYLHYGKGAKAGRVMTPEQRAKLR